jgi:predicted DNA-binding transcriptional regulator YafY
MKSSYQKITVKQLANNLDVSIRTAERYYKDIKQHFNIKIVLEPHVQSYFKIDAQNLKN